MSRPIPAPKGARACAHRARQSKARFGHPNQLGWERANAALGRTGTRSNWASRPRVVSGETTTLSAPSNRSDCTTIAGRGLPAQSTGAAWFNAGSPITVSIEWVEAGESVGIDPSAGLPRCFTPRDRRPLWILYARMADCTWNLDALPPDIPRTNNRGVSMLDIFLPLLGLGSFASMAGYAACCTRI